MPDRTALPRALLAAWVLLLLAACSQGGGGEYPLQDGFGCSNGVTLQLLRLYGPGAGR